jgi:hypothetical protein
MKIIILNINTKTNKIALIAFFAMLNLQLLAQKRPASEFSLFGGMGMPVSIQNDVSKNGLYGDAGIGVTVFFGQQTGIHIGLGLGLNDEKTKIDNLKTTTNGLIDADIFYNETQKSTFVTLPVMFLFKKKLGHISDFYAKTTHYFYAMGGTKILMRYQTNYESSVGALNNLAANAATGYFEPGMLMLLAFETGVKLEISKNTFLYAGAFVDYGLNDPAKNQRKPVDNNFVTGQLTLLTYSDKIHPTTVGIKLRLAFSLTPKRIRPEKIPCPPYLGSK